jgi:hypothetical protein
MGWAFEGGDVHSSGRWALELAEGVRQRGSSGAMVVGVKERCGRFDRRGADYAAASKHGAGGNIDRF